MKKLHFRFTFITIVIGSLLFVSAGCGKKPKPVVPSAPGAASKPAAAKSQKVPTVAAGTSQSPAKTDNRQLHITAGLGGRDVRGGFIVPANLINKSLTFNWNAVANAVDYKAAVLTHRLSTRTDRVAKITPLEVFTGSDTFFTIPEIRPLKNYSFTVTAYDTDGNKITEENVSFRTAGAPSPVSREDIYFNGPNTTPKEMRDTAKRITVPVWKADKNGKKYGGTLNVTVHKALADVVLVIFTEIYNGLEQFPIHDLGGVRAGSGDHGLGLAVDINANENWYKSKDGKRTAGKLWEPYKNQYSITPYGDVVTSFERHGFAWGGDSWPNNFDFMHFFFSPGSWP